jgi:hypothetical protein
LFFQVFLKLCADNKQVITDTEDEKQKSERLCTICARRNAEVVTLYTKVGVKVTIPFFVCSVCAEGKEDPEVPERDADISDHPHDHNSREISLMSFEDFLKSMPQQQLVIHQDANKASVTVDGPAADVPVYKSIESPLALFWKQAFSIAGKNARLHSKEMRTNVCFIVLIVLINALSLFCKCLDAIWAFE